LRTYKTITLSFPPAFLKQIEKLAKKENRTKSELFREALRRYMAERKWESLQREMSAKASSLGIKTEADVERIVDENCK
jgi:CopG family transcriptional regulator/antitoxin EndoAI